ncbi:MAG: MATE family efflux transporter [Candidatus Hydrogenedentes bacterium]|nr:MATE family efflux transporter [Candidatus Hydrogenedentota bacterium]
MSEASEMEVVVEPRWAGLHEVVGMAGPIVLSSMSWTIMQFVDQYFVAKLGSDALAAVGSAGVWAYTLSTFFVGIAGCVSTFASQTLGRGQKEHCSGYAWQGIYLSILAGVMAVLLWPISEPLFRSMGHTESVTRLELDYFRIRLLGYVFIAWSTSLSSFFQAVGRPRIPMYVAVAANVLNVALAYGMIFGKFGFPVWGVAGAAAAMVIALGAQSVVLQLIFLSKPLHMEFNTRSTSGLDTVKFGELFRIGWPAGTQVFMDIFNWSIFTSYIVGYFGTASLAAHNVAISFMQVSFMPAVGLHHGIVPIVGQWIGRGDVPRAKARTYTALKLAIGYMFVMGLFFAVYGPPLIRFFFSNDVHVVRMGHILLILAAIFQAFDAINIVTSGALRGAGDTRWMAVITVAGAYLVFLPLAIMFAWPLRLGAIGAWIGATIYIIGISGFLFRRFHGERWRRIRIFHDDQPLSRV